MTRKQYLLEKEQVAGLDKSERYELQNDYSLGGGLGSRELLIDNLVLELGEVLNTEYGTDGPDFNNAIAGAIRQQIEKIEELR